MDREQHLDGRFGLHERAISSALLILEEDAKNIPQLRAIAEKAQFPLAELQQMFASDSAVLVAAAQQGFIRLHDRIVKALVKGDPDDSLAQFQIIGQAYLQWVCDEPEYFLLIEDSGFVDVDNDPELRRYRHSLADLMRRILQRGQKIGCIQPGADIDHLINVSRSFIRDLARETIIGQTPQASGKDQLRNAIVVFEDYLRVTAEAASIR